MAKPFLIGDRLAQLEAAGFTDITTKQGRILFTDRAGKRFAFPFKAVPRGTLGTDYLVAGPGTGAKLDGAYEHGTGIISEYALLRLIGHLPHRALGPPADWAGPAPFARRLKIGT